LEKPSDERNGTLEIGKKEKISAEKSLNTKNKRNELTCHDNKPNLRHKDTLSKTSSKGDRVVKKARGEETPRSSDDDNESSNDSSSSEEEENKEKSLKKNCLRRSSVASSTTTTRRGSGECKGKEGGEKINISKSERAKRTRHQNNQDVEKVCDGNDGRQNVANKKSSPEQTGILNRAIDQLIKLKQHKSGEDVGGKKIGKLECSNLLSTSNEGLTKNVKKEERVLAKGRFRLTPTSKATNKTSESDTISSNSKDTTRMIKTRPSLVKKSKTIENASMNEKVEAASSSRSKDSNICQVSTESDDDENVALASKLKKKAKKLPNTPVVTEIQNSGFSKKQKEENDISVSHNSKTSELAKLQQQQTSSTTPKRAIILPIMSKHHKEKLEAAKNAEIQKVSSTPLKKVKDSLQLSNI